MLPLYFKTIIFLIEE